MSDPRPPRTTALAIAAVLVAAVLVWLVSMRIEPLVAPPSPAAITTQPAAADGEPAAVEAGPPGTGNDELASHAPGPASADRDLVTVATDPVPTVDPLAVSLTIRLRGLHPDAPWTAPVHLDLDGRDDVTGTRHGHDASIVPDAAGICSFPVPAWVATGALRKGRVEAHDDHYLRLQHRWDGPVDLSAELVLDVQVTGVLEGRVVDTRGDGVPAVRVRAFAMRDSAPSEDNLGENNTRADGTFWLQVPPGVPLLLLAMPLQASSGSRLDSLGDGAVADTGDVRSDLLPASVRIAGLVGSTTRVPDLVLPDAAALTGTVRWADGKPVLLATVRVRPSGGRTLRVNGALLHVESSSSIRFSDAISLHLNDNGSLSPSVSTFTDDDGAYRLPAVAGAALDVALVKLEEAHLIGEWPTTPAMPPERVDFTVPRPTTLRVVHAGKAVPYADIEIEGQQPLQVSTRGQLDVIVAGPDTSLRARHQHRRSPWTPVGARQAGRVVTLELADALGAVTIEFEGEYRVRNTTLEWRSSDGREGREHLLRDDRSGPFRLFLEPGHYHLRAGPGGGERNGVFLLPVERDVEVANEPVALVLPALFGGTFVVMATDSNGLYVPGTCSVRDGTGTDQTAGFVVEEDGVRRQGRPGELLSGGPNSFLQILSPGDYELLLDFQGHGAQRQRMTIRPREITEVRVRL